MADTTADNIGNAPISNTEAKVPESASSLPPIAKEPVANAEAPMVPTTAPGTDTTAASAAPSSEPVPVNEAPSASAKEEVTNKMDAADTLALQPEKPTDPVPTPVSQPPTTDTTETGAPSVPNGDAAVPPKPVSVEEVRDQDLPASDPPQPAQMTGALKTDEPVDEATKTQDAPVVTTGPEATAVPEVSSASSAAETNTGDKRKAEAPVSSNGESTADGSTEDAPADKKQKTNSEAANGTTKKPGRPKKEKKDKKELVAIGKTARKTRSQGTAD